MKFYLPLLFAFIYLSCQINGQHQLSEKTENKLPSRGELLQQFRAKKSITIVYDAENQDNKEALAASFKQLATTNEYIKIDIKTADELPETSLATDIIVYFGTPTAHQWIAEMLPKLPFDIKKDTLFFDGQKFSDSSIVMKLPLHPSLFNPQIPMQIITSYNENALLKFLQSHDTADRPFAWAGWSSWGYEVYRQQQRIIYGYFGDQDWQYDKKIHFDFSAPPDSMPASRHFEFYKQTAINEAQLAIFQRKCEAQVSEIRAFLNTQKEIPLLKYHLYRSAEEKGLMIRNTEQSSVDWEQNSVHTVLNETYNDNFIGKENEWILRQFLGEPKILALERGLAIYFTKNWQRKGYQFWAKKLFDSGNILPLAEILDEKEGSDSRYLNGCLSASFVEFLIEEFGKDAFIDNYAAYQFSAEEIVALEKKWHQFLKNQTDFNEISNPTQPVIPYLKGFNFAHEGYQIYNGYGSRETVKALEKVESLGANSIAIVPYTFMRNPKNPEPLPIYTNAGNENDESVVETAYETKKRGMTAVLKPQIWVGNGSWPGEIEMKAEADWQKWFSNYHNWVLHYAMLAEIHEIEVLCVGTELVKTTLQRPDDWQRLLKKIRAFYSGKITYAANWGDEFEKITFWNELDFIGLDCYYPLSKKEKATDKDLKKGFSAVMDKIEQVYQKEQKPVLFTEIGFRSVEAPWLNPHAEPDRPFNEMDQKRCYSTVFEGIDKKPWCQGILWWKFPSYLNHRQRENTGFSPYEKAAERVVQDYW